MDQKSNPAKENFGIRALPNLDFKIVAANTLIAAPKDDFENDLLSDSFFTEFNALTSHYFKISKPDKKKAVREDIEKLINTKCVDKIKNIERLTTIGKSKDKKHIQHHENDVKLWQSYANLFKHEAVNFFEPRYFFPQITNGFDIVIGNPPYGVSIKNEYRANVVKCLGKVPDYEIYYYFIEAAYLLLKEGGIKTFIIPNTFLFNVFAEKYREKLLTDWEIKCLTDCTAFKLFEAATVFNAITVFTKNQNEHNQIGYKYTDNALDFATLSSRKTMFLSKQEMLDNNKNWGLLFKLDSSTLQVISKIKKLSVTLGELFPEYSHGLIAYDKYQGQSEDIIKSRAYHHSENEKGNFKKWLWGADVLEYKVNWNGKEWIDYCDGIANPRQPKFFRGKRVLIREITNPSIFAVYCDEEFYHDPAIIVVLDNAGVDLKFLLAILNSRLASFYHFNSSPKATKGAFPKILVTDIKNFPIPKLPAPNQQPFIDLADKILAAKQTGQNTRDLEKEIDSLVYALYGLTDEEVAIVEGGK